MPLPPALLARLSKRGIIKPPETKKSAEDVEEVFAEDYDEPPQPFSELETPEPEAPVTKDEDLEEEEEEETNSLETIACPNKSNPYHECSEYCRKRYGKKEFTPDPDMERRRFRMLNKYPLPEGWEEIPDVSTGRYYYWNMLTDQVSWLAPLHPKSQITMPVTKVSESISEVSAKAGNDSDGMENESDMDDDDDDDDDVVVSGSELDEESEEEVEDKKRKDWNSKRESKKAPEELDPMDPASYSNAPRGTWSTGLDKRGEAKTGADVTATGPLYQQRPYPAPGDVLRMNRQLKDD